MNLFIFQLETNSTLEAELFVNFVLDLVFRSTAVLNNAHVHYLAREGESY